MGASNKTREIEASKLEFYKEKKRAKRCRLYLIGLIWASVGLQIFINSKVKQENIVVAEAMAATNEELSDARVTAYGYYNEDGVDEAKRVAMVKKLAGKLGVEDGYDIDSRSTKDGYVTALKKIGEQANTTVKVITLSDGTSYFLVQLDLKGVASKSAYEYKEKLTSIYAEFGVEASTNLYMETKKSGELSRDERDIIISDFLADLGATEVSRLEFDNVDMVYGYTKSIDEFVYQDDEKVNVNIAFEYNEVEDVTYIDRGIPFVDRSF